MTSEPAKSILIVEDEPIIALDLKALLEREGYLVTVRYQGYKALDLLERVDFNAAIVDIHLKVGNDGIEIGHLLSEKRIPFIYLTSFYDQETLEKAAETSPAGYLVKPFQPQTLLSSLMMALNRPRLVATIHPPAALTGTEEIICNILSQGKSYQEIADQMSISINTVRFHIKNIYVKYDVSNRAQLLNKLLTSR